MLEIVRRGDEEVRLYFSSLEERDFFYRGVKNLEGIREIKIKEQTKSLLVRYQKGSFAEYFFNNLNPSKPRKPLTKEDLYFYFTQVIRHPLPKLLISMATLGKIAGLVTFTFCSLFFVPLIKSKL